MIVAVSGNRKIGNSFETTGNQVYEDLYKRLLIKLAELKLGGLEKLLSGAALGFDQMAMKAAIELNIDFEAVIPFKRQSKHWPSDARKQYFDLLKQASQILIISEADQYAAWAFHKRNRYLVDNSDLLLCYLPPECVSGGTFACVSYAKSVNRNIINLGEPEL